MPAGACIRRGCRACEEGALRILEEVQHQKKFSHPQVVDCRSFVSEDKETNNHAVWEVHHQDFSPSHSKAKGANKFIISVLQ
jgi:hypothetical protein